jgi:spore coat polysaccharide biosynthesis protein SpsF (cytidylyltransferase family)
MHTVIGIQARSGSTRLERKCLQTIGDATILDHCVNACRAIVPHVWVLPPVGDEPILNHCRKNDYLVHQTTAPEDDVLSRYIGLQRSTGAERVVRITADCPFPFIPLLDWMVRFAVMGDFHTNAWPPRTILDGWDIEVMSPRMLEWLDKHSTVAEREHVTAAAYRSPEDMKASKLVLLPFKYQLDMSSIKYSVDTQSDLDEVRGKYRP